MSGFQAISIDFKRGTSLWDSANTQDSVVEDLEAPRERLKEKSSV